MKISKSFLVKNLNKIYDKILRLYHFNMTKMFITNILAASVCLNYFDINN